SRPIVHSSPAGDDSASSVVTASATTDPSRATGGETVAPTKDGARKSTMTLALFRVVLPAASVASAVIATICSVRSWISAPVIAYVHVKRMVGAAPVWLHVIG